MAFQRALLALICCVSVEDNSVLAADQTAAAPAPENQEKRAKHRAMEFLTTLKKGDAKGLKGYYAPKVLVKGGSELLKAQWGLNPGGDRSKDLEVERDKLLERYAKLFAQVGNKRTDVWARILKQEGSVTFSKATKANQPFGGVKKDDVVVRGSTGVVMIRSTTSCVPTLKDSGGLLWNLPIIDLP